MSSKKKITDIELSDTFDFRQKLYVTKRILVRRYIKKIDDEHKEIIRDIELFLGQFRQEISSCEFYNSPHKYGEKALEMLADAYMVEYITCSGNTGLGYTIKFGPSTRRV